MFYLKGCELATFEGLAVWAAGGFAFVSSGLAASTAGKQQRQQ
jgi:hypothetical protein